MLSCPPIPVSAITPRFRGNGRERVVTITPWPYVIHNFILPRFISGAVSSGDYIFRRRVHQRVWCSARLSRSRNGNCQTRPDLLAIARLPQPLRNYPECELTERNVCASFYANFLQLQPLFCARKLSHRFSYDRSFFPARGYFFFFFLFANSREICDARRSSKSRSRNG